MLKGQLPVARRHDPLAGWEIPLLNFFVWVGILGTLTLGVVTIWFFITVHAWVFVGFLVVTILFGFVWRVVAQRVKNSN
jgi:hypothetical protein